MFWSYSLENVTPTHIDWVMDILLTFSLSLTHILSRACSSRFSTLSLTLSHPIDNISKRAIVTLTLSLSPSVVFSGCISCTVTHTYCLSPSLPLSLSLSLTSSTIFLNSAIVTLTLYLSLHTLTCLPSLCILIVLSTHSLFYTNSLSLSHLINNISKQCHCHTHSLSISLYLFLCLRLLFFLCVFHCKNLVNVNLSFFLLCPFALFFV